MLLNGQRIVSNPYLASAVDLNTIPTVAIERIEVLRDGASAIYGTDAIAGVVNIITRKEYQGISVAGQGTWPSENGGEQYSGQHPRRLRLARQAGLEVSSAGSRARGRESWKSTGTGVTPAPA